MIPALGLILLLLLGAALGCSPAPTPTTEPVGRWVTRPADQLREGRVLITSPSLRAGIPGRGRLTLAEVDAWLARPENHQPLDFALPIGLDESGADIQLPEALTRAKIELGRQLFFDRRLSSQRANFSCADCHIPRDGWLHPGHNLDLSEPHGRTVPTIVNRLWSTRQMLDGRAASLEDQVRFPLYARDEMDADPVAVAAFLRGNAVYRRQLEHIYGEVSVAAAARALAAFERTLVTGPAAFDIDRRLRRLRSEKANPTEIARLEQLAAASPYSEAARRGETLFFSDRAGCSECHVGANFTDERFHNVGVGLEGEAPDLGRYEITGQDPDWGAFRTPTLRNVAETGPYMHRGQLASLREVVAYYNAGGSGHPRQDPRLCPLELSEGDIDDLVAFLRSLSGAWPTADASRLPE